MNNRDMEFLQVRGARALAQQDKDTLRVEDVFRKRGRVRKVGRNEVCPCKSGKKFKRCCGSTVRR